MDARCSLGFTSACQDQDLRVRRVDPRVHAPHPQLFLPPRQHVDTAQYSCAMSSKTCFVTVGATASFSGLVKGVLQHDFLEALENQGYTDLLVQYGEDGQKLFDSLITTAKNSESGSVLNIKGFTIDKAGLAKYMRQAKGIDGGQEGVVISHAGTLQDF